MIEIYAKGHNSFIVRGVSSHQAAKDVVVRAGFNPRHVERETEFMRAAHYVSASGFKLVKWVRA